MENLNIDLEGEDAIISLKEKKPIRRTGRTLISIIEQIF